MQLSAIAGTTVPAPYLWALAIRSVTAWSEHDPAEVASCFEEHGQQSANNQPPVVGREALKTTTQEFMTKFPDIAVRLNGLKVGGERVFYEWMLTGTDSVTERPLCLSGFEVWTIGSTGLIENSHSWYDSASVVTQIGKVPVRLE